MNSRFIVQPGGQLQGRCRVPGDKSISHRAVMLGALADGITQVNEFLEGDDCLATAQAFEHMGVRIERDGRQLRIHGVGLHGLKPPAEALELGNSGTSMRLLSGLLAGQRFDSVLTGDNSLRSRPMARVIDPVAAMGGQIQTLGGAGRAPLHIHGGRSLVGIDYASPVASAQIKSCVLLAGLYARGRTRVREPGLSRDHTERMLEGFGYRIHRDADGVGLEGGGRLQATRIDVPADISSAAFLLVGAAIVPGSDLLLEAVGINPTRIGVIDILKLMGADITVTNPRQLGGEPVADLQVRGGALNGIDIPVELVPSAIDEFPALFVAAACAEGVTRLQGAAELRVKESDRIGVMAEGLATLGVHSEVQPDGLVITGVGQGSLGGGRIHSHDDHRIAMSFAMAALRSNEPIVIDDCDTVATSFPGFAELTQALGLPLQVQTA